MRQRGMTLLITLIAVSGMLMMNSCKKEKNASQPVQAVTVNDLQADTIVGFVPSGQPIGAGVYTFYSLENNAVVDNADSATNKWDLGFRGTTIITNGGNSGPASGGAFIYVGTFSDLAQVPADSTFKTDNAPSAYAIRTGSGNGWYSYDGATNLVTPIPGRILVIRTASGKYAKVEILNYYKGGVTPDASASDETKLTEQRYYTFKFAFQPNGSTTF